MAVFPDRIIKRDHSEERFDVSKIAKAIEGANNDVNNESKRVPHQYIPCIAEKIGEGAAALGHTPSIEEIQDLVENELMNLYPAVGKEYIKYRYKRQLARNANTTDASILTIIEAKNEEVHQENSNKNPDILSVQRDYMAGEVSKDLTNRILLPREVVEAHKEGIVHFHDADYFAQHMHNCDLVNMEDMLQNGTVISGTTIEKPHSFSTACNIATQIIAQVASSQYGGQTVSLAHLVPFVDISRKKFVKDTKRQFEDAGIEYTEEQLAKVVEDQLDNEIERGIQTVQYQLVTLMTTNGQTPFVTIYMDLGEARNAKERDDLAKVINEVLKQRIKGIQNATGQWVTPAFPKLIYTLYESGECANVNDDDPYTWLTWKCAECTAKRMVPDYISAKKMYEFKYPLEKLLTVKERRDRWGDEKMWGRNPFKDMTDEECDILQMYVWMMEKKNREMEYANLSDEVTTMVDGIIEKHGLTDKDMLTRPYTCMGCRSFLTPDLIHYKTYGRFNQGVMTISLPDVALSADGDEEKFWKIFDERLELCHEALRCRHERLLGTVSDVAPMLWQYGALARLKHGEVIDKLLYDGYSTISLGYAGLYECVYAMKGCSHTSEEGKPFALAVMQYMNDKCAEWKAAENIDYSIYGTPIESTTYKFAKALQRRFGVIDEVSSYPYITNSYHVNVREEIDAFSKLAFESEFQRLSPGGAISYVECAKMFENLEATMSVIRFISKTIIYAEMNIKSDFCQECGYTGEILIKSENEINNVTDECGHIKAGSKLMWQCPQCGNTDQKTMNVARRTCGYIGSTFWNQGRTAEIRDRYVHI